MSFLRRGAVGLALTALVAAALAPAAHADNLAISDGLGANSTLALGNVCRGQSSTSRDVTFALQRRGDPNSNTWASDVPVSITGAPSVQPAGTLTLGSVQGRTTEDWATKKNNFDLTVGKAGVSVAVPSGAALGAASASVTWSATGTGFEVGSLTKTSGMAVTWNVTDCTPKDTTPPVIGYTLDPAQPTSANGWYREDVSVTWSVADGESTATATGCQSETFTADGPHSSSCSATSQGGSTGPVTASVKIDRTPPSVVPHVSGDVGDNDWYTGDVTVSWDVSDATSGIDTTSADCAGATLTSDTPAATYTCTVVDEAGNQTEVSQEVKRDATKPVIKRTVAGKVGNGDWYVGDVTVDWTVSDATSDLASSSGCDDVTLTTDTNGETFTCSATDKAGNTASDTVTVKRDATPPVITYMTSGTEGDNGWYRGPVLVTWDVTDAGSGVAQACDPATVSGDGVHDPECQATDVAGNLASSPALVQIDGTAPVITESVNGPKGNDGWYVGDVSVSWTITDATSRVASSSGCDAVTVSTDTTGTTYTCSATDVAGNSDSQSVTVKRDATAPVLTLTGGPASGATYDFGDVPAASTCVASDPTSGLEGDCSVTAATAVGSGSQVATATDKAGNTATDTRNYTVAAWKLDGFYKPVTMGTTVVNTVKAGSTVPLKFNVLKGGVPMTSAIGATFSARKVGCDGSDIVTAVEEFGTTGSTTLRYDASGGQWVQNWATPSGGKGSCYRVTMTTADGTWISADFALK